MLTSAFKFPLQMTDLRWLRKNTLRFLKLKALQLENKKQTFNPDFRLASMFHTSKVTCL